MLCIKYASVEINSLWWISKELCVFWPGRCCFPLNISAKKKIYAGLRNYANSQNVMKIKYGDLDGASEDSHIQKVFKDQLFCATDNHLLNSYPGVLRLQVHPGNGVAQYKNLKPFILKQYPDACNLEVNTGTLVIG